MHNTETAHGPHTDPKRSPAQGPDEPALNETSQNPFQPFLQFVSGTAAFSSSAVFPRNETSATSGGPRTRGHPRPEQHETGLLASFADNPGKGTWELLQALPTLEQSPLAASDLRAERHEQLPEPLAGRRPGNPDPNQTDSQAALTPPPAPARRRRRRFRPAAIVRFILLMISISLIAASLVLMSWPLFQQQDPYPNGRVNLDAVAIAAINR